MRSAYAQLTIVALHFVLHLSCTPLHSFYVLLMHCCCCCYLSALFGWLPCCCLFSARRNALSAIVATVAVAVAFVVFVALQILNSFCQFDARRVAHIGGGFLSTASSHRINASVVRPFQLISSTLMMSSSCCVRALFVVIRSSSIN